MQWSPPLTSSQVSASLVFGHPSHPENMGFIRIGLSSLFDVACKQLRCLWIMFHYSLSSYIPDPLHHVDNNTPICMTQALYTSVCSHRSGWVSDNRCSHLPLYCSLCHETPWGPRPPVTGAPYPSCRLCVGWNCGWRGQDKLRTVAPSASGPHLQVLSCRNGRAWGVLGKRW